MHFIIISILAIFFFGFSILEHQAACLSYQPFYIRYMDLKIENLNSIFAHNHALTWSRLEE